MKNAYKILAYTTFNCIAAFILLNVVLGVVFFIRDKTKAAPVIDTRVSAYREKFTDYAAYTRTPPEEITALLDEQDAMGTVGLQYEPWVGFRNPQVSGRFLNTNERGFRATHLAATRTGRPVKVFVFGGSTTFGYGVRDEDTIPSYLQKILEARHPETPIEVRNFGQGFYYSSQEQQVLIKLLKDGEVPDWAVFIDGGNDTAQLSHQYDDPVFTPKMKRLWNEQTTGISKPNAGLMARLPIGRLGRLLATRLSNRPGKASQVQDESQRPSLKSEDQMSEEELNKLVDYTASRYLSNVKITRAVCRDFGVKCLFIWQPHPAYKYDRALHKRFPFDGAIPQSRTRVFARMETHQAPDFLFLGHMLEKRTTKSYVDDVHYNEAINEEIAGRIADTIHLGGAK